MARTAYPSNISDSERAIIAPLHPQTRTRRRKRDTDFESILHYSLFDLCFQ
ncbi:hypothetical protein IQ255_02500 [Pleurocapsales cyanobacterium LEGE 10410]|nr:hypothetical protein [Pleurocapsales cyanobacterium LEGE 10410]